MNAIMEHAGSFGEIEPEGQCLRQGTMAASYTNGAAILILNYNIKQKQILTVLSAASALSAINLLFQ